MPYPIKNNITTISCNIKLEVIDMITSINKAVIKFLEGINGRYVDSQLYNFYTTITKKYLRETSRNEVN